MEQQTKKIIAREFLIIILWMTLSLLLWMALKGYNYFIDASVAAVEEEINRNTAIEDSLSAMYNKKLENWDLLYEGYLKSQERDKYELWERMSGIGIYSKSFAIFNERYSDEESFRKLYRDLFEKKYFTKSYREFRDKYFGKGEGDIGNYDSPEVLWAYLRDRIYFDSLPWNSSNEWQNTNEMSVFKKLGFETPLDLKIYVEVNSLSKLDSLNAFRSDSIRQETIKLSISKGSTERKWLTLDERRTIFLTAQVVGFLVLFVLRYLFYGVRWSLEVLRKE